jgi:hypothetical protein
MNMIENTLLNQIRDLTHLEKLQLLAFLTEALILEEKSTQLIGGEYDEWSALVPHPAPESAPVKPKSS